MKTTKVSINRRLNIQKTEFLRWSSICFKNKQLYALSNTGVWFEQEYDKHNNVIEYFDSNQNWEEARYDENNMILYATWGEYDID